MKTTDQTLSDQQLFLLAHRRHHHFVHFARIFMLLLFLTVWELFARGTSERSGGVKREHVRRGTAKRPFGWKKS